MKKILAVWMALTLFLLSAGCGAATAEMPQEENSSAAEPAAPAAQADVDIDLTALSSTMVYSEVYNMMNAPEDYIGKTVRAKGPFAMYHDEQNDNYFFAVRIQDATACCAQGLEFVWAGDHTYPDDYPALNTEIEVCGRFNTYMDGTQQYSHLEDATMVVSPA